MPSYDFENKETGEIEEHMMKIADKEQFLKDNPHLKQVIGAPNIIGSQGGRASNIENHGFKEVLQRVGENTPGSYVDRTHNRRTSKQVKTDAVVKKHKEKNK